MARVRGVEASADLAKKAGGGKFLTLEDGDCFECAFVGVIKYGLKGDNAEPFGCEVVWIDGSNGRYSVEYDPKTHSEDDMRVQFAWNVLVRGDAEDGSGDEVKIFQQGPRFFKDWLRQKDKKGRSGYNSWFTIGRIGKGQFDTKYTLDREEDISEQELADLKNYELHDLEKETLRARDEDERDTTKHSKPRRASRARAADAPRASGNGSNGNGSIISDAAAGELRQLIQDHANAVDVMTRFKERFAVDKLKNLPSDKESEARAWLGALGKVSASAQQEEVDPFE